MTSTTTGSGFTRISQAPRIDDRPMTRAPSRIGDNIVREGAIVTDAAPQEVLNFYSKKMSAALYVQGASEPVDSTIKVLDWLARHRGADLAYDKAGDIVYNWVLMVLQESVRSRIGITQIDRDRNPKEYELLRKKYAWNATIDVIQQQDRACLRNLSNALLIPNVNLMMHMARRLPKQLEECNNIVLQNLVSTVLSCGTASPVTAVDPVASMVHQGYSAEALWKQAPNGGRCQLVPWRKIASVNDARVVQITMAPDSRFKEGEAPPPFEKARLFAHAENADFLLAVFDAVRYPLALPIEFSIRYGGTITTVEELENNPKCVAVINSLAAECLDKAIAHAAYLGPSHVVNTVNMLGTDDVTLEKIKDILAGDGK